MAVIARILAAASVLSLALVSTAPAAVGAVTIDNKLSNRNAHIHHAHALNKKSNIITKNGKRCKARSPASSAPAPPKSTPKASSSPSKSTPHSSSHAAAPAQSSKAAGGTKNTGGGNNGGNSNSLIPKNKKWLPWANGVNDKLKDYAYGIGGIYTWTPDCPPEAAQNNLECAPMLWGYKSLTEFRKKRESAKYLMGMNEVNLGSQSQMSVSEGIKMWNEEVRPYASGRYLVAPSTTTAPDGKTWLKQFFDGCGGSKDEKCGVNALSAHVYGKTAQDVIDYCTDLHETFGLPVWLSEYACQSFSNQGDCNSDQTYAFMNGVIDWAEKTEWMHMIAPFGAMKDLGNVNPVNALMTQSGAPSALGKTFLNA